MSERLHITREVLESSINGIARSRADLEHAQESAATVAQHVGHSRLEHELQAFAGNWRITRGKLTKSMAALEANLRGIATTFKDADDTIADKMPGRGGAAEAAPRSERARETTGDGGGPMPAHVGPISTGGHSAPAPFVPAAPLPEMPVDPGIPRVPVTGPPGAFPDELHPLPIIHPDFPGDQIPGIPGDEVLGGDGSGEDGSGDVPPPVNETSGDSGGESGGESPDGVDSGAPPNPGAVPGDVAGGGGSGGEAGGGPGADPGDAPPLVDGSIDAGETPVPDETAPDKVDDEVPADDAAAADTEADADKGGMGVSSAIPIGAGAAALAGLAAGNFLGGKSPADAVQLTDSERVQQARSALEELRRTSRGMETPS